MMRAIRGKDTVPELAVRRALRRLGYKYRLHAKGLPGRPDIVLPSKRLVVLVHGCFWHRHARCTFAYTPKSRVAFWEAKFRANVTRDRRVKRDLRKLGWDVLVIWECKSGNPVFVQDLLMKRLSRRVVRRG